MNRITSVSIIITAGVAAIVAFAHADHVTRVQLYLLSAVAISVVSLLCFAVLTADPVGAAFRNLDEHHGETWSDTNDGCLDVIVHVLGGLRGLSLSIVPHESALTLNEPARRDWTIDEALETMGLRAQGDKTLLLTVQATKRVTGDSICWYVEAFPVSRSALTTFRKAVHSQRRGRPSQAVAVEAR